MSKTLTDLHIYNAAMELGVEPAVVKAVATVESSGGGFYTNGFPKILFEAAQMYKYLKKKGIDPVPYVNSHPTVVQPTWDLARKYYTSGKEEQRLQLAMGIDKETAYMSASWGMFQVMGFNHKICGWNSVIDFVEDMKISEEQHLKAFLGYCKTNNLIQYMKNKNWAAFAKGYNGTGYAQNQYDTKMLNAYSKIKLTWKDPIIESTTLVVETPKPIAPETPSVTMPDLNFGIKYVNETVSSIIDNFTDLTKSLGDMHREYLKNNMKERNNSDGQ